MASCSSPRYPRRCALHPVQRLQLVIGRLMREPRNPQADRRRHRATLREFRIAREKLIIHLPRCRGASPTIQWPEVSDLAVMICHGRSSFSIDVADSMNPHLDSRHRTAQNCRDSLVGHLAVACEGQSLAIAVRELLHRREHRGKPEPILSRGVRSRRRIAGSNASARGTSRPSRRWKSRYRFLAIARRYALTVSTRSRRPSRARARTSRQSDLRRARFPDKNSANL